MSPKRRGAAGAAKASQRWVGNDEPSSENTHATAPRAPQALEKQSNGIAQWILDEGRFLDSAQFMDQLCLRLVGDGVPIGRAMLSLVVIHPQIRSTGYRWLPEAGCETVGRGFEVSQTELYLKSPIKRIHDGVDFIHARLVGARAARDLPFYDELRADGMTDYAIYAVPFSNGFRNTFSVATRAAGGFSAANLALLRHLMPLLAMATEVHAARRTAEVLLDTYVGRAAGQKILKGLIQRGHGERIRAVIWFSDLRGFSALSDMRGTEEVIATLNDFFDALAAPIEAQRGQILKFIGDGLLAIFPLEDAAFEHVTCRAALDAALETRATVSELNRRRVERGEPALRHNVALHIGDVVYGNIGAAERLDFTAIGPAVNLAARLESLAAQLDVPVVFSEAFAAIAGSMRPTVSLGRHALKGLLAAPEVFTVAEFDPEKRAAVAGHAMAEAN